MGPTAYLIVGATFAAWLAGSSPVLAQATEEVSTADDRRPPPLREVKLEEHLGARLPLQTVLRDADDQPVALRHYFRPGKPVLLTLAYVECPMLCSLVLRGVSETAGDMPMQAPQGYRLITVGIDPSETATDARKRQEKLNEMLDPEGSEEAWVYLRGGEKQVRAIAAAIGFGYAWDPRSETYAHPAAAIVVTGDGVISKYFHGISFSATPVSQALRSAASGEVGSAVGQSVLSCFLFDPALRKHRELIQRYFRIGASSVFGSLLLLVAGLFAWERRRRS